MNRNPNEEKGVWRFEDLGNEPNNNDPIRDFIRESNLKKDS